MKSLIITLSVILFFSTNAYSSMNCDNVKKTSPKYLLCKTVAAGSSIKNKWTKKSETKNKSDKKSIFKKFGEAKTLSDLKK